MKNYRRILAVAAGVLAGAGAAWGQSVEAPARPSVPGAIAPAGSRVMKDIVYAEPAGSAPLKLDLYLPAEGAGPAPVVVWVHGGGWIQGSKEGCPAALLVPKGFAAVSISYRFTNVAKFPAQLHDCKAAIRWVRAHAGEYNLDADHIGVWGGSAGGHLVALLGTTGDEKGLEGDEGNLEQSSAVRCVVDWFGPMDIRYISEPGATAEGVHGMVAALVGGTGEAVKENAALASPITHITKDDAPFLIMHGDQDTLVTIRHSEEMDKALRAAGVECEFVVIKGGGHGPGFGEAKVLERVAGFFEKWLK
ncbi:MAG: alpha/beta hydrolase [Phycisphaerales bacterium]|nr:alpha/beta hydrolase [Phycisphaerales bacterium]